MGRPTSLRGRTMRDARGNIVRATARSLGQRGLADTTLNEVVAQSGEARGSLYHFFPRGKDELVEDAVALIGSYLLARLRETAGSTPLEAAAAFVAAFRDMLREDCESGCPLVTIVVDNGSDELRGDVARTFDAWTTELARLLHEAGMPTDESRAVAALFLAACEGAVVVSRAERSVRYFDVVADALMTDLRLRTAR